MFNREVYDRSLAAACAGFETGALDGRRFLVTGATGLVGSFLVDALAWLNAHRGANVAIIAAGRSADGVRRRFGALCDAPFFRYAPYDATKPVAFDFEADCIVHAACSAHPLAYSTDPVGTMQANLIGTMNLLEYARGGARLLLLSTGEIYGENPDLPEGFSEGDHGWVDSMNPRACYPESKRAAETLCAAYARQHGVDALVARLCHVYGPTLTAQNSRADAQFLRRALAGEPIVMKSTGAQVRSFCYAADAVNAILTLLARGGRGEAYNVANRQSVGSIRDYAETLAAIAGVDLTFDLPPEAERAGYTKITRAVLNPAKLEALGWTPQFDLRAGLEATVGSLKDAE